MESSQHLLSLMITYSHDWFRRIVSRVNPLQGRPHPSIPTERDQVPAHHDALAVVREGETYLLVLCHLLLSQQLLELISPLVYLAYQFRNIRAA